MQSAYQAVRCTAWARTAAGRDRAAGGNTAASSMRWCRRGRPAEAGGESAVVPGSMPARYRSIRRSRATAVAPGGCRGSAGGVVGQRNACDVLDARVLAGSPSPGVADQGPGEAHGG